MKRSSSTLDQQSNNNNNNNNGDDDEYHQTSYKKRVHHSRNNSEEKSNQISMDQCVDDKTSLCLPHNSLILGSFSQPPTYVIHYLDTHLTFLQSFQICSLFGRISIHGHNLRPLTYYSIYNYRTNSPITIQSIPSSSMIKISLENIQSLIPDIHLAEKVYRDIQDKHGDILLIRNELNNNSLFPKIIREHRIYHDWFFENYSLFQTNLWNELEKNLQIRLIETNNQTVIAPSEQFCQTKDRIIQRWLNESTQDLPFVVLICGEKDMGKSTFIRYLINSALNHINSIYDLTYFDCDIGQCEFTIGGCLSYTNLDRPLFGPPCSHMKFNSEFHRLLYYGFVTPQNSPVRYLQYIDKLRQMWNIDHDNNKSLKRSLILINTMGWGTGLGLELLKEIICMCCPNMIIQLGDTTNVVQDTNRMPDITLQWLLQQPVYSAYRHRINMSNKRQADYDGHLNYEYIKIQSTASSNLTQSNKSKLRPRDHRLLATWSYFFSSIPSRIHLPWSQFVHVSLQENVNKNFNTLPDCLEHSIVAFCLTENIDQLRKSAIYINGMFHLTNYQDEIFQCLGFGWIEHCDKQNQTYEIYTPNDRLSNINTLVSGTFDTPDEFAYIFKRLDTFL